jgi:hypothetical protein
MKNLFIALFIFLPFNLAGQGNYMSLSFGGIIPLNNYKAVNDLSKNGYALNGFSGDYSGAFFFGKNTGIAANIKYASNSLNEEALWNSLVEETFNYFNDTTGFNYKTGMWNQVAVTIGPQITCPLGNFNLDLYTMAGVTFIFPPKASVYREINNTSYLRKLEINSVSYALDLGFAVRYHLNEVTSIRFHGSYSISHIKGNIYKKWVDDNIETSERILYSCPVNAINIGIGIVYRL